MELWTLSELWKRKIGQIIRRRRKVLITKYIGYNAAETRIIFSFNICCFVLGVIPDPFILFSISLTKSLFEIGF
jgi:hypothetical protein